MQQTDRFAVELYYLLDVLLVALFTYIYNQSFNNTCTFIQRDFHTGLQQKKEKKPRYSSSFRLRLHIYMVVREQALLLYY